MKTKKQIFLAAIASIAAVLMAVFLTQPYKEVTKDSPPDNPHPKPTHSKALSQPGQNPPASSNQSRRTVVDTNKHASDFIKSNPSAAEIPYYLLATADDPYYSSSWPLAKLQTDRAWDLSTGSSTVKAAVIDTGFALDHEELGGRWALNYGESGNTQSSDICWNGVALSKQTNNCDDDQNGYTDDWRGFDFYSSDNSPAAGETNPSGNGNYHGTAVAGALGATANNEVGASGIDQAVSIMPLQVFNDDGVAYTSDVVAAVEYAVDNGADVINLSLGTNQYDPLMLSIIQYAKSNNVLVVAASGNCALNDEAFCNSLPAPGRMTYPALYPETLAVGATNSSDQRADYSSYGDKLDLVAPGSAIGPLPSYAAHNAVSTYISASGTSFAAPMAAGTASLLIAQNPDITTEQLEFILTESADRIAVMTGNSTTAQYGSGRLNAHKATLLGLANTQKELLGEVLDSPRQPAIGSIWRAASGNINNDESVLVGCRVYVTDSCSVTVENISMFQFYPHSRSKGNQLHYIFIAGNQVPAGHWKISVHNNAYATGLSTLLK